MSNIRKAHSVEIIDRRLQTAEAGTPDLMELVGLHDELARVDRKWRAKAAAPRPGGRPLADAAALDARFDRLARLVAAALRRPGAAATERAFLRLVAEQLRDRSPLAPPAGRA